MTPRQARVAMGAFVLLAAGVTGNALYLQGSPDRVANKPPASPPAVRSEPQRPPGRPTEAKAGRGSQQSTGLPPAPTAQSKAADSRTAGSKATEPRSAEPEADTPQDAETPRSAQSLKVRTVRVATVGEVPPVEASPNASASADTETVRAVQAELNRRGYGPLAADGVMRPAARAAVMAFEHEHRLPLTGEASQELLKQILFGAAPAAGAAGPPEVRSPQAQGVVRDVQRQLAARGYRPGAADGRLSAETIAAIRTFEADQGLVPKGRISAVLLDRLESGMAGGGRHRDP
ncbi:MAG TPA: peptidoglycan-binding protein [Hyphomicrobiaceae bacterium]|nr:peptidoglycan-binding protein [Hyphomicrobiaceae bacterium]